MTISGLTLILRFILFACGFIKKYYTEIIENYFKKKTQKKKIKIFNFIFTYIF